MKRWILAGLLGLSILTPACAIRANFYRRGYDRNYRHYDYDRDYPVAPRR